MRNTLIFLLLVTFASAKDAPRAILVSTPTPAPSTIWTEEEANAYFDPTPTPIESPVSNNTSESTGVAPGQPVMLVMLFAMVILGMFIIGVLNYPNREPQYENEPIKQIQFDDLERQMNNPDRRLVVREKLEAALKAQEAEEQEAAYKAYVLERGRKLAEAEALLKETELREAARRETERQLAEAEALRRLTEAEAQRRETRRLAEAAAWASLILPQATKEALETYCELLSNHQWYANQGIFIPKGLLFYGPPGCGKTETARLLSKKAGFSFVSLSSADLKVGWIGQAAVAIQKYFDEARQKAPCIVYIDEIEASCPTRTSGQNSVIDNEVNAQLLQEFDGIKTTNDQPVFVFASTNRIDLIDPAILERFTQHIEIALPTAIERFQLLDIFIGKVPFDLSPPDDIEAELEAHGCAVDWNDYGSFTLYGSGTPEPLYTTSHDEALLEAWNIVMTPDKIITRLATATEGQSGRQLKNMVTKANMVAVKRSYQDGVRKPVTRRESDFDLINAG
jgi:SpoVK/Ycf46/Vps4 family AAA+-type ATPase